MEKRGLAAEVGLAEVAEWYESHTGLTVTDRHMARLIRIQAYMSKHGLGLDDLALETNWDRKWGERRNRSGRERKAELIGSVGVGTGGGSKLTYFWLLPKKEEGQHDRSEAGAGAAKPPRAKAARPGTKRAAPRKRGTEKPARRRRPAADPQA